MLGEDHLRTITQAMDVTAVVRVCRGPRGGRGAAWCGKLPRTTPRSSRLLGRRIDEIFNPDGDFDEADRARRRGVLLGPQGPDGMSRLAGWIDPETRCYVEAVAAAVRPGRHLPDGTIDRDSPMTAVLSQRCHDGIKLGLKAGIASGELGAHRGHPVTVIARTTLAELNQAAHAVINPDVPMPSPARTGGDTALPMRDLIRMAADAIHYWRCSTTTANGPCIWAARNAIATADQRIICYARDGGCTRPNCPENPAITARSTTARTGTPTAPRMQTSCSSPADLTRRAQQGSLADDGHRQRTPGLDRRN